MQAIRIGKGLGQAWKDFRAQGDLLRLGRGAVHVDGQVHKRLRFDPALLQVDAARLQAGQIEQVIDDRLQALAVLAGGKH